MIFATPKGLFEMEENIVGTTKPSTQTILAFKSQFQKQLYSQLQLKTPFHL